MQICSKLCAFPSERHKAQFFFPPEARKIPSRGKKEIAGKGMEIPLPGLHLSVMQKGLFQMAAIGNANEVVNLLQTGQTVLELLKILLFGKTPLHFA